MSKSASSTAVIAYISYNSSKVTVNSHFLNPISVDMPLTAACTSVSIKIQFAVSAGRAGSRRACSAAVEMRDSQCCSRNTCKPMRVKMGRRGHLENSYEIVFLRIQITRCWDQQIICPLRAKSEDVHSGWLESFLQAYGKLRTFQHDFVGKVWWYFRVL